MKYITLCPLLLILVCLGMTMAGPVRAQDANASDATVSQDVTAPANSTTTEKQIPLELQILNSIEQEIKKKKGKDIYERSSVPSLVFTPSQYALLREARIGFNTRIPTLQELAKIGDPNDPNYRPPVSLRDIKLGGISFNTPDDWTIWLNNSRVTPDALPSEAIDLRVYKDFIEVKWFDVITNQIYPIRLRINQKFNIDSRIFLPG
jgi:hypothetical protein